MFGLSDVGVTVVGAAVLRAFIVFGLARIAVLVVSLLLLPSEAVVLVATLKIAVSSTCYKEWWGKFPVDPFLPMITGSFAGTAVGVYLLSGMSRSEFQLWIGLCVIAATLPTPFVTPSTKQRVPQPLTTATGVASGFMIGDFLIP